MKILLVDNDTSNLQKLFPILRSAQQHEVRVAVNGEKALENAEHWEGVDVLVTEVFMEPMNGITLRNKLRNRFPDIETIFISGYDLSDCADHLENSPVLPKPCDPLLLLRTIEGVAGNAEPPPAQSVTPVANATGTGPNAAKGPAAEALPAAPLPQPQARPGENPEGKFIGNYKITRKIEDSPQGEIFQGQETGSGRQVALEVLSPNLMANASIRQEFLSNALAKTVVKHPVVLPVFEAADTGEWCFYSFELLEGARLDRRVKSRRYIDGPEARQVLASVADAFDYFLQYQIAHSEIEASSIIFGPKKTVRLGNLAIGQEGSRNQPQAVEEIKMLGRIVRTSIAEDFPIGAALKTLLTQMTEGTIGSWAGLVEKCQELDGNPVSNQTPTREGEAPAEPIARPKATSTGAGVSRGDSGFKQHDSEGASTSQSGLEGASPAAPEPLEPGSPPQKRPLNWGAISLASLILVTFFATLGVWRALRSNERALDKFIRIPTGEFIYQNGQRVDLPDFWISEHEVTIGQYARFVQYLEAHPDESGKFDHPAQPKGKSHKPQDWEIYYGRAKAGKPVKFIPIDLNCPVFLVDWWDAYAYAKWRGMRLPSEQEWEKAARGTDGRLFPWGNDWNPKNCNSNADYNDNPQAKGAVDGFNRWSPVDAIQTDKSPFGVIGMAGNVSEWTYSWETRKGRFPVIRGGNYHSSENQLIRRVTDVDAETTTEYLGFRLASDRDPASKR